MSRLVVAAVALALSLLGSLFCNDAALAERRVALVIGNSAYQHVPALRNPTTNAQAMAAMLQKAGFDVIDSQYDAGGATDETRHTAVRAGRHRRRHRRRVLLPDWASGSAASTI